MLVVNLFIVILVLLLSIIPFIKAKGVVVLVITLLTTFSSGYLAVNSLLGQYFEIVLEGSSVFGPIPIRIDALSAWFILIINITCLNGVLYGIGYLKPYADQKANVSLHWILFPVFQLSMLLVCVLQNGMAFLIAWEIMSLSSLLLVVFEKQKSETVKAGINYLVQMHISVVFLTTAFLWIYFSQNSFDFQSISTFFSMHRNGWLFFLFFIGFGFKAGFIPFHTWLPQAHPAAPSHISGVMSGVIVKMGIYGIIRMALMLRNDVVLIGEIILVLSVLTGIYGILNASVQSDFKKMLAYCTIENIGIIGIGIGLGLIGMGTNSPLVVVLGFGAALLHTLNHSLFKSLLFFSAGSVYQQTHTRNMEKLGGLVHKMPQTSVLFLIGAIAIGGLPPFNGFVSEFLIYSGFLAGLNDINVFHSIVMMLSLAGLAIIGGLSIMTFTKNYGTVFLGSPRSELVQEPLEVSLIMRIPQFIIVVLMLSVGIFPQFYFSLVLQIVHSALPSILLYDSAVLQSTLQLMGNIGLFSFIFLLLILLIYLIRNIILKKRGSIQNTTWGCGYVAPKSKMQYTGKSFSKTLGKLFGFIVKERKKYDELNKIEVFPLTRSHSSHYVDFFENNFIDKPLNILMYVLGYFGFLQNGRTQSYVLYGVFFILLVFIFTIFKII